MKKILFLTAAIVLTMSACKKDRTCTCTITFVSSTDNGVAQTVPISTATQTKKLTKVSKTSAHCNSGEQTETTTDVVGGTTHTYIDVTKADCKLD